MDLRALGAADVRSVARVQPGHRAINEKAVDTDAVFIEVFAGHVSVHGIEKGPCGVASSHHHGLGRNQCSDCCCVSIIAYHHFATSQMCDAQHRVQKAHHVASADHACDNCGVKKFLVVAAFLVACSSGAKKSTPVADKANDVKAAPTKPTPPEHVRSKLVAASTWTNVDEGQLAALCLHSRLSGLPRLSSDYGVLKLANGSVVPWLRLMIFNADVQADIDDATVKGWLSQLKTRISDIQDIDQGLHQLAEPTPQSDASWSTGYRFDLCSSFPDVALSIAFGLGDETVVYTHYGKRSATVRIKKSVIPATFDAIREMWGTATILVPILDTGEPVDNAMNKDWKAYVEGK